MDWSNIIKLALAALFGAAASIIVNGLKGVYDDAKAAADEFVGVVRTTADAASKYWLMEADAAEFPLDEVKLLGLQRYLDNLRLVVFERLSSKDRTALTTRLGEFYDAVTGGDFQVNDRSPDPRRATDCQVLAAEIMVDLRMAHRRSLALWPTLCRTWSRSWCWILDEG